MLDYAIVEILDSKGMPLRYHELVEEIEKHCKISSSTLTLHLKRLAGRNVVERRLFENGHTAYALTKKFKGVSEIQRKKYPNKHWEMTLALEPFVKDTFEFGIPEVPRPSIRTYWPRRKTKRKPAWML
jgi:DNA-binding HxlR family transcriptional regulator